MVIYFIAYFYLKKSLLSLALLSDFNFASLAYLYSLTILRSLKRRIILTSRPARLPIRPALPMFAAWEKDSLREGVNDYILDGMSLILTLSSIGKSPRRS